MTSRLRRKPPTTARSTAAAKALSRSLGVAILVGAVTAVCSVPAAADSAGNRGPIIQTVSYSMGSQGSRLKWLSCRPKEGHQDRQVKPVQFLARAESAKPLRTAQLGGPMNDPFGDRLPQLGPPSTSRPLDDNLLAPQRGEPMLRDSAPDLLGTNPSRDSAALQDAKGLDIPDIELPDIEEFDRAMAAKTAQLDSECESPQDVKKIYEITNDISAEDGEFPNECTLSDQIFDPHQPRPWTPTCFTWKASGLCHKPLYFEDVHLERYGHSWGPYLQPVMSGGHFFLTVPILPYLMGLNPPHECMYTLGYYRPGNCAPYLLDPIPISVRAGLAEAGVWTGMVYLIP